MARCVFRAFEFHSLDFVFGSRWFDLLTLLQVAFLPVGCSYSLTAPPNSSKSWLSNAPLLTSFDALWLENASVFGNAQTCS